MMKFSYPRAMMPTFETAQTTVTVDFEVGEVQSLPGDYYHFVVGDPAGQTVFETEGYLESGDITVVHL